MGRIHAFDWLRGVAVLVMIQTHCVVLLRPELRSGPFFLRLDAIDGLVAPAFVFSAGFALALVQVRAGMQDKLREQARKSLRRIGEVLAVASLINFIWFPVWKEPWWLLRIDILHCIGLSLLLVLPLLVGLASRPRWLRWALLLAALALFAAAPFGEQATGVAQLFLNNKPGVLSADKGAGFPLLPWAGYVFLGASFGATVAAMRRERELWAWLGLLGSLGAVLWWRAHDVAALYPPHSFWTTSPGDAARRWTLVVSLVALFRALEIWKPAIVSTRPTKWLSAFGGASLSAYFFHEMLLYQRWVGVFTRFFRGQADWRLFWVLVVALIACTWVCVQAWNRVEPRVRAWLTSKAAPPRPAS